jgi:hypothetical protein
MMDSKACRIMFIAHTGYKKYEKWVSKEIGRDEERI